MWGILGPLLGLIAGGVGYAILSPSTLDEPVAVNLYDEEASRLVALLKQSGIESRFTHVPPGNVVLVKRSQFRDANAIAARANLQYHGQSS